MTDLKKTSERVVGYCPLGGVCEEKTKRYREYARFLEDLAEKCSPLLFCNGGTEPGWCPGKCGNKKRYLANVEICKKEGLNPEEWLDKITGDTKKSWDEWRSQQKQR